MNYLLEYSNTLRYKFMLSITVFGLLSFFLCSYTIGSSYLSVSGYGDWSIPGQELVLWFCLLGMSVMLVCSFGLFFSKFRYTSAAILLGCGLMVFLALASVKSADKIRMLGFERLSMEAAPLVTAIHEYEIINGHPPETLDVVDVKFPQGHEIKGGLLPDFIYMQGELARERYHGNHWILLLEAPTGPLKWDHFIYYPEQNYPTMSNGGWLEIVGDWAYVHE